MAIHAPHQIIQWKSLLIENYRDLHLTEEAVMVLLVMAHLKESGLQLITPDALSHLMMLSPLDIDTYMVDFGKRGWIETREDETGSWETVMDGLQSLLIKQYLMNHQAPKQVVNEVDSDNLFDLFEKELGHSLSSLEIDVIRSWFEMGYTVEKIRQALYEALIHRARSVHYVDKILLAWSQQEERSNENYTTIDENWRHDIKKSSELQYGKSVKK